MIPAELKSGKVKIDGREVNDCIILCEGDSDSSGAVIQKDNVNYYVTNTQPDTKTTIGHITDVISGITALIDFISAECMPASPPFSGNQDAIKAQLNVTKGKLETLKGKLL